jgi:hypothetical protein
MYNLDENLQRSKVIQGNMTRKYRDRETSLTRIFPIKVKEMFVCYICCNGRNDVLAFL